MKKKILASALVLFMGSIAVAACDGGDDDYYASGYGGIDHECRRHASCGTCTPIEGCGWCQTGVGTGLCVSDPDECAGATAFSWTWDPSGCVGAPVTTTDAGAPVVGVDAGVATLIDSGAVPPEASTDDSASLAH